MDTSAMQRLKGFVSSLKRKKVNIQQTLGEEFSYQLLPLQVKDFPVGWPQEEFQSIRDAMTKEKPIGNEGKIMATVKKMTNTEAEEMKQRIIKLAEVCGA